MSALHIVRADQPPQRPQVDLLEQWSNYMIAYGCSPGTVRIRTQVLTSLIRHAAVTDPLQLTRAHVVAWLGRPELKQWSRQTYWKAVHKWSEWLREFGHDPQSDLTKGLPRPKTPQPVARPIPDDVVERMLAMELSPRAHAYIRLALFQALRVHEIAKLAAEDFDLDTGWLMIKGKGGITKPIPIHVEVAKLAADMPAYGYWFPSPIGAGHVSGTSVSLTIGNVLKRCGANATAHQLRDTAATRMQRQVKDIRLTQAMLRHSSITSTMKYTEASNDQLQAAVTSLDWQDRAQQPMPPTLLADMSREQLQGTAAQLLAALAEHTNPE
jgi:integrase/recombinase XerD